MNNLIYPVVDCIVSLADIFDSQLIFEEFDHLQSIKFEDVIRVLKVRVAAVNEVVVIRRPGLNRRINNFHFQLQIRIEILIIEWR